MMNVTIQPANDNVKPAPVVAKITPKTFVVGQTYSTRSACDHDCVFSFTVISRTAKRITIENRHGERKSRGVYSYSDGVEHCKPLGTYSMCPVISADSLDD